MDEFYREMVSNNPSCVYDIEDPSFEILKEAVISGGNIEQLVKHFKLNSKTKERLINISLLLV